MTGISTLAQALDQIERIKDQQSLFATLATQLSTGKIAQKFTGLDTDVLISKRARADFKSIDMYMSNITNANRRIRLMLNSIEEFKAQAEDFANSLMSFSQQSVHQQGNKIEYDDPLTTQIEVTHVGMTSDEVDGDFAAIRQFAGDVLSFMKDLLNAQENDRYLLGGADTLTRPLNDTGTLDSAISSLIGGWKAGTISTDNLVADLRDRTATAGNPDALTDTIIGYSAALSSGNVGNIFIRADEFSEIDYTALANEQPFRDIVVAAAYLMNESLPPMADAYIEPNTYPGVPDAEGAPGATLDEMKDNFFQVFNQLTAMVNKAIDDIDQVRFKLENVRARLNQVNVGHQNQKTLLLDTIGEVEDADTNEVAVRIQQLQIQLEASFRVTAKLQDLSLANFLVI